MPADERSLAWFRAAYGEALRSAQALAESLRRVELPASAEALEAADAGTRERIDAFVLRFLRLQDAIWRDSSSAPCSRSSRRSRPSSRGSTCSTVPSAWVSSRRSSAGPRSGGCATC